MTKEEFFEQIKKMDKEMLPEEKLAFLRELNDIIEKLNSDIESFNLTVKESNNS